MLAKEMQLLSVSVRGSGSGAVRYLSSKKEACQVLIVGAGCGGCAVGSKLSKKLGDGKVVILEPSYTHYYQPMFSLIGGGIKRFQDSHKRMADIVPKKAKWIKEKACRFDPKSNTVITEKCREITYDVLIMATGLQLNYNRIPGLVEALEIPDGMVSSIYSPRYVNRTYAAIKKMKEGTAIFTYPATPVKCPGAPQKILYIAEDIFRKTNRRQNIDMIYNTALPVLFGVKHYAETLWGIVKERYICVNLNRNLIEVRPHENIAIFQHLDVPPPTTTISKVKYNMLHVVPPMSTPDEVFNCRDLVNADGFVDVDKNTLQHVRFQNVFAIGDCSSTPNSKTVAAAATQSPVIEQNVMAFLTGKKLTGSYDGYSSCPIVTQLNRTVLAEFNYNLTPLETFPFDQNKERYSMYFLKAELLPRIYWHMMLRGYWNGPEVVRNAFSYLKFGKKEERSLVL